MSFEKSSEEPTQNVASPGFDLNDLAARKKMHLNHVRIEQSEIEETGKVGMRNRPPCMS